MTRRTYFSFIGKATSKLPVVEVRQTVAGSGWQWWLCVCMHEKSKKRYIMIAGVHTVAVSQTDTARKRKGNYDIDLFLKLIFQAIYKTLKLIFLFLLICQNLSNYDTKFQCNNWKTLFPKLKQTCIELFLWEIWKNNLLPNIVFQLEESVLER